MSAKHNKPRVKLRRIVDGTYETADGRYRIIRVGDDPNDPEGNETSWMLNDWCGERNEWAFMCEFLTLTDARRYLDGDTGVFILS